MRMGIFNSYKVFISALLISLVMLALSACGSNSSGGNAGGADSTNASSEASADSTSDVDRDDFDNNADTSGSSGAEGVDVDLTTLSASMVYGQVNDMMINPDNYIGKTVKMGGLFAEYIDEKTGKQYYACIIEDATACCAQGFEFIPEGLTYPDDFPEEGNDITVTGVFDTYNEGEAKFCTLRDATIG